MSRSDRALRYGALACALAWSCGGGDDAPAEPGDDAAVEHSDGDTAADGETADGTGSDAAGVEGGDGAPGDDAGEQLAVDGGDADGSVGTEDGGAPMLLDPESLYARSVESFSAGANAGFGSAKFPDVVLGPPKGNGVSSGSLDVLSLGVGGEIVLAFAENAIVDGDGPDFLVFENAFWPSGNAESAWMEPGQVAVSEDGESWLEFPCAFEAAPYAGCAGVAPTLKFDPLSLVPLDPELTGGDAFDLADVGLANARYVRIQDRASSGSGTSAGFDLDAVGVIHLGP